jgi:hypothetical protein
MDQGDTRRKQILLANLIILTIIIFGLIFVIAAYPTFIAPDPTSTPTITNTLAPTLIPTQTSTPSLTPTITNTPRPSFTPTITSTPTRTLTPTPSLTPLGPPTLTAAWPLNNNLVYQLPDWSPEKAQNLIALMNNYPNTFDIGERGEDNENYFAAFEYAVIAQKEGIMRFPDSSQSNDWRWDLAYNLARTGDSAAGQAYVDLILSALNRAETDLPNLKKWFNQQDLRMNLYLVEMEPIPGYKGSYLVEVRGSGSAFIWLLESSTGFSASTLETNFDYVNQITSGWITGEFTGDPTDGVEAAFYFSNKPKDLQVQPPAVFNLGSRPKTRLPFVPEEDIFNVGMEINNYWAVGGLDGGQNTLVFESQVYHLCPVTVRREYIWNGDIFAIQNEDYSLDPQIEVLNVCEFVLEHAEKFWGPHAAAQIIEELLPVWPPPKDIDGEVYPLDAADELRFKLGINYALLRESKKAKDILAGIISNPSTTNSAWITPAQEFLDIYKLPDDIYRACVNTIYCDADFALSDLVEQLPAEEFPKISQHLLDWGIETLASGFFDFEKDSQPERWFTTRHRPIEKLGFWILVGFPEGGKALKISTVDTNPPEIDYLDEAFTAEGYASARPVVFLDNATAFNMLRIPGAREPFIEYVPLREEYPSHFDKGLSRAEEMLFRGVDPAVVYKELKDMQSWPGLLCETTWSCDRYYYMLGLASELSGKDQEAVDAYLMLWRDYSRSPFTTMARLKLSGPGVQPTLNVSQTPTATATFFTSTPGTATGTPSLTPTITGTILATSTPSPTGTTAPYP